MSDLVLLVGIVLCALQAIRAPRLLYSALWLGCTSAFLAVLLFILGAHELAVLELSIGSGLITVLLVFVLNLTGERRIEPSPPLSKPLALGMVGIIVMLLGWFIFPLPAEKPPLSDPPFSIVVWEDHSLNVLVQVVLIFTGALTVLGLLAESRQVTEIPAALEEVQEPEERAAPEPEKDFA